ncbi:MAG: hypothetical protein EP334_10670 [Gammaproteobacteria bacterium]|nr:MAG: hypothetical protein EP334_10670 [Gammaproteobacteria bacterium]
MDKQTKELTYTYLEVQALLSSLSEADIARLLQSYRIMGCESRAGLAAHDILSEVTCKVLASDRAWPREVDTLPYLIATGRSVISNEEKKHVREVSTNPSEIGEYEVDTQTAGLRMEVVAPPEFQAAQCQADAILDEWVEKVRELFVSDKDAMCFITQKLAEMKKAAILLACQFSDQAYRSVEKRIKDKVRKRFPEGIPWWEIK